MIMERGFHALDRGTLANAFHAPDADIQGRGNDLVRLTRSILPHIGFQ